MRKYFKHMKKNLVIGVLSICHGWIHIIHGFSPKVFVNHRHWDFSRWED